MNKVLLIGRLTRDPEIKISQSGTAIARYTLAVDRRFKQDGGQDADFLPCVAFGRMAEFAEKYFHKGLKIAVTGRLETGSYTKENGDTVYTTTVIVEEQEFVESKSAGQGSVTSASEAKPNATTTDGFMDLDDDELPFV